MNQFPVIDPVATGRNILLLRQQRGLTVRDIQKWFNFEEPRCIYKWQSGQTLPSVDNLYALSALLGVSMDSIVVGQHIEKPQAMPAASLFISIRYNCLLENRIDYSIGSPALLPL